VTQAGERAWAVRPGRAAGAGFRGEGIVIMGLLLPWPQRSHDHGCPAPVPPRHAGGLPPSVL